ncbi:hypothetical protein [Rhodococcus sp. H29-C3]|uniref:hypothetical protein n=1 Tax=Rhodococcus sp. H29-C3 TaxID=3046307 RepID=UPI0024B8A593|nr:hypothetical protein [Rhodococcus sp. H29-C3]MDJ0362431.1 hypothetical protein [Rhodococcus sp. H29-C3]
MISYEVVTETTSALSVASGMAGSHDTAREWATTYDERASTLLTSLDDVVRALENYCVVLNQAGHNHSMAESAANGSSTATPEPPSFAAVMPGCTVPLQQSAGGPGNGLEDYAFGIADAVGIPVPDGDTENLRRAGALWRNLSMSGGIDDVLARLRSAEDLFFDIESTETDLILDDMDDLRTGLQSIQFACGELADSCEEYAANIDELRSQLYGILEDLAEELTITAAISIAAACISFGASAVVGTAKSAESIKKYGTLIGDGIAAWSFSKSIGSGVRVGADLGVVQRVLQRLKSIGQKVVDAARRTPPKRSIDELFANGSKPKASELEEYAQSEGWTKIQTANGPPKYIDENGVTRLTIKSGTDRAPGSGDPHVEIRNADGQRVDPFGNEVTRRSTGNHTPIEWDLP